MHPYLVYICNNPLSFYQIHLHSTQGKISKLKPGMVIQICIPSTWEAEAEEDCEFEARLGYIASSGPA
jgi:hypothetical protein